MNLHHILLQTHRKIQLPKLKSESKKVKKQCQLNSSNYRLSSNDIILKNDNKNKTLRKTSYLRSTVLIDNKNIHGYTLGKQIGKGGFAKVYQVTDSQGEKYAMKQYNLQNTHQCFINQCAIGRYFFQAGTLRENYQNKIGSQLINIGAQNLIKFVDRIKIGKKGYIVQQLGGNSLLKVLSDIQGVFYENQRVYQINFKDFYYQLASENNLIQLFQQICSGVHLLNHEGYIHCDLKSQNILINSNKIIKIIDYGSTFNLDTGLPKITITPEYMPPQLLNTLQNDIQCRLDKIDIWSLGCILLQILTGIPLWFRYKCKLMIKGKVSIQLGPFAMTNRDYTKIMKKQRQLAQNINKIQFIFPQFQKFRPILKKTLELDPNVRINSQSLLKQLQKLK